jgi:bacillithiol biosynthesis cysteine-adding enzyme BshC
MILQWGINIKKFYSNDLFRDYIFDFRNVMEFYEYDYRNIENYRKRIFDIEADYDDKNRIKIYDILKNYNKKIGCSKSTLKNIERFKSKRSLVVIGGQQPGFLTGPIFIIFKILTVLKLSSYFKNKLKVPVIPCFWNASDDSNTGQIDNLNIINGEIANIKLDLSDFDPKTRYSDIYLDPDRIKKAIEKVAGIIHSTDFTSEIIDFYKSALKDTVNKCTDADGKINIPSFFSSVITRMFSDHGIVMVDPAGTELKKLSLDLLEFDMENHDKIKDLIVSTGRRLNSKGYHSQLNPVIDTLDFFLKLRNSRIKIYSKDNESFRVSGNSYHKKELQGLIRENPGDVSLNVVLRPLLQDSCLPVLCSVCGPGEVSYFAQLKTVYEIMGMKMPVIYPRFSATVIESNVEKLILELKIKYTELGCGREEAIKKVIGKNLKIDLSKSIKGLENDIEKRLEALEKNIEGNEMNVSSSFDRIKRNIKKEIEVLHKKIYSEYKKQNEFMVRGVDKLYLNIFPNGNLQEREINIISYLNKYGFRFIDDLYESIEPLDFLHKFLEIN